MQRFQLKSPGADQQGLHAAVAGEGDIDFAARKEWEKEEIISWVNTKLFPAYQSPIIRVRSGCSGATAGVCSTRGFGLPISKACCSAQASMAATKAPVPGM